ncbi:type 1 fimbrial protein [Buttiauxella sp. B2]|uniref:fimbrial protein n=1 Tax=Buttiauxella sp. B2 TaxID=2587812 RepID=UPI0011237DBC|nr:fimbrial protein [Buttiauxella sp. B2]TNV20450.1 type 1 fimbrial protein [Buttiauxella sp. B2]
MSLIRAGLSLLVLLAVGFDIQAACSVKTQKITVSPETLMSRNNSSSGAVLKKSSFAIHTPQNADCDQIIQFSVDVPGGASKVSTLGVYQTNAKGVGVKFTLVTSSGREITWPAKFSASLSELSGSKIIMELIKVDNDISSRNSSEGMHFEINNLLQASPLVDIYIPSGFVTVQSRSCQIYGDKTRNVTLPGVLLDRFKSLGAVAGRKPFDIHLTCTATNEINSAVYLKWNGQFARQSGSDGVLRNSATGHSAATGIGVQVLDDENNPLNFQELKKVELRNAQSDKYSIRFYSQYYQIDENVRPGKVHATLYFNIDYQ